jgi:prophage antirepressor-like protein
MTNTLPLRVFNFQGKSEIRFIDDMPVANDVALALGYSRKSLASTINKKVFAENKGLAVLATPGGDQEVTVLKEAGIYQLIFSSKLSEAKKFQQWVFEEVLPTIRKKGVYADTEQKLTKLTPEEIHANLLALGKEMQKKFPYLEITDENVYIVGKDDFKRQGPKGIISPDPLQYWYAMEERGLPVVFIANLFNGIAICFDWYTWYEHHDLQTKLALFEELKKVCLGLRSYNRARKLAFHGLGESQRYEEVYGLKDIEQAKRVATAMQKTILEFFQKQLA